MAAIDAALQGEQAGTGALTTRLRRNGTDVAGVSTTTIRIVFAADISNGQRGDSAISHRGPRARSPVSSRRNSTA